MHIDRVEELSKDHDLSGLLMIRSYSLTNYLDQLPLSPPAVELAVEDPFPRTKVEPPGGDGHHREAHPLSLQVGVAVALARAVVAALFDGRVGRQCALQVANRLCVSHPGLAVVEHGPDRPPVLLLALTAGIAGVSCAISTQTALVSVFPYQVTSTTLEQVLVPASHTW